MTSTIGVGAMIPHEDHMRGISRQAVIMLLASYVTIASIVGPLNPNKTKRDDEKEEETTIDDNGNGRLAGSSFKRGPTRQDQRSDVA